MRQLQQQCHGLWRLLQTSISHRRGRHSPLQHAAALFTKTVLTGKTSRVGKAHDTGSAAKLQALFDSLCAQLYSLRLRRVQNICTGAA